MVGPTKKTTNKERSAQQQHTGAGAGAGIFSNPLADSRQARRQQQEPALHGTVDISDTNNTNTTSHRIR